MESNKTTETVSVTLPGPELGQAARTYLDQARAYKITSPEMYEAAGSDLRAIVTKKKNLNEQRLSITRPLDEAKERIMAVFRDPIGFLEQAELILKRGMSLFDDEQARIRREEEARQRRVLEEEQRRLAAEAAKAEEDRKRLEEEARRAEVAGQHDQAEQLAREADAKLQETNAAREASATMPTAIVAATEAPKAEGVSFTETWSAEVTDLMSLVKAVAAGTVPLACVVADMKVLNQQARALKAQLDYPGVRAVATKSVSARRVA